MVFPTILLPLPFTKSKKKITTIFCYSKHIYLLLKQPMDVDSIFNLFTQNDQDVLAEHNSAIPIDTSVSQFISIIFAIENYQLLDTLYCFKYPDKYKYVRDEVQLLYYTNIIKSLSKQGVLRSQDVVTILSELSIDRVVQALNEVLYYMEQKELYNECSIIFKFVQLFNVN